jgi:Mor family transcriptional regulator
MAKSKDLKRLYNAPDNEESDNKAKPQVIKLDEALDVLERPKLDKGQQEEGNKTLITALIKAERVVRGR